VGSKVIAENWDNKKTLEQKYPYPLHPPTEQSFVNALISATEDLDWQSDPSRFLLPGVLKRYEARDLQV